MTTKQLNIFAKAKELFYFIGATFTIATMWYDLKNTVSLQAQQHKYEIEQVKSKQNEDMQALKSQHKNDFDFLNYKLSLINKP